MPHGVSDYAVGSAMQKGFAYAPMATLAWKEVRGASEYEAVKLHEKRQGDKDEKKASTPKFTVKDITITKGPAKDEVLKVVQAHLSEIDKCYNGKQLPERLTFNISVNRNGIVKKVKILATQLKDDAALQCIVAKIMKWQFPASKDGRELKATITLVSRS
jgi:hypothetical protein